ncbi:carbohydrate binding family 9 domain-containing protein [Bacteroidota bacterium]
MIASSIPKYLILLVLLFTQSLTSLFAQKQIEATRFDISPRIDGIINEECWQNVTPITTFYQREPNPGSPSTVETKIYLAYDAQYFYMAVRCFSDPEDITAKELARDVSLANDDRVQLILDTYLDKRNAYWFQIGPRGSIGDAIVSENGASFNKAWDGLWTGKAQIHESGWDAEIAIPFKTLSFDKNIHTWGLKLIRYQKSSEETIYWPEANINTHKFQVSDAGLISGLKGMSQGVGLDLIPYGLGGIDFNETQAKGTLMADAGIEAYYNISSSLKAAISVNTDFAQTEVDQRKINLTRFSLHYPEKRDIFLDGANYFNFGINGDRDNQWNTKMIPFFSRRIGLDGDGNPIPVQYGGKVTGQSGQWNIGAMYMKDKRNGWQNGNFTVARISRNLGGTITDWHDFNLWECAL